MIYFASYPRAGRIWIERRLWRLAYKYRDEVKRVYNIDIPDNASDHNIEVAFNQTLKGTHFFYDPFIPFGDYPALDFQYNRQDKVFLLLRNAGDCTYSLYFYLKNRLNALPHQYNRSVENFMKSNYGYPRYINFLEKCNRIKNIVGEMHYFFYEDLNTLATVKRLPAMLGLNDLTMTDEEWNLFMNETNQVTNTAGTVQENKPADLIQMINQKVVQSGVCAEYTRRYL